MKARKISNELLQIMLSVSALVILALLVGNVAIILMASRVNADLCRNAAESAALAYEDSGSPKDLQSALYSVLTGNGSGGFFISSPALAELKCYTDNDHGVKRTMLSVKTVISVRLPAPFLALFSEPEPDGMLHLKSKCILELKPSSMSGCK